MQCRGLLDPWHGQGCTGFGAANMGEGMQKDIDFPASFGTRFTLFVDTEEEFEWGGGFSRDAHSVSAVPALRDGQTYFRTAGVRPVYLVDLPIIESAEAVDILGPAREAGECDIGAHLHPWVTPPFDEDVTLTNSYAGNLPEAVERAKIRYVRDKITEKFKAPPQSYRAGRYGIGPNSFRILAEEGFVCDTSIRSLFDYRGDGGPDFRWAGHHPHWVGPEDALLELPLTTIFIGHFGAFGRKLYGRTGHSPLARSVMSRLGVIERVPLTPEGIPADKACAAIDSALEIGLRLLNLSFHSPSLAPGHTPYVRDAADLVTFYRWWDTVLNHCSKRGVQPAGLHDVIAAAHSAKA